VAITLQNLTEQIQKDLGFVASNGSLLQGSNIVPPAEIQTHIRDAIEDATTFVHTLYEDYFLVPEKAVNIVAGTNSYAVPTGLYINKMRRLIYDDGSKKYDINFIKNISDTPSLINDTYLQYIIVHELGIGYRLRFYPTPQFTSATFVKAWYLREPKELLLTTDEMDLPKQCKNFVLADAKLRCLQKIPGDLRTANLEKEYVFQRERIVSVLKNKVPDNRSNELQADFSDYNDSVVAL